MNGATILGSEITASGSLSIKEGAIHDLNLTDALLSQLDVLPGITFAPSDKFKNKYPFLFSSQHTEFNKLAAVFEFANETLAIKNIRMETPEIATHSEASLDFDGNVAATGSLIVSPEVTRQLIRDVSEIRYLRDSSGSLVVPFLVSGQIPTLKPRADLRQMGKILKEALSKLAAEKIRKGILEKLVSPKSAEEDKKAKPDARSSAEPTLEELLVEKGLDVLFGR